MLSSTSNRSGLSPDIYQRTLKKVCFRPAIPNSKNPWSLIIPILDKRMVKVRESKLKKQFLTSYLYNDYMAYEHYL